MYFTDYGNNRIRKVTVPTNIISTIAGTGASSFSGDDGLATSATFDRPTGLALDTSGNIYVADEYNNRIRKVTVGGTYSPRYAFIFVLFVYLFIHSCNILITQSFSNKKTVHVRFLPHHHLLF